MKTVLAHFYYGSAAGNASGEPAWHVAVFDVAETMEDVQALGGTARRERTLNMAQATEAGISLAEVAADFNQTVAAHAAQVVAENAALVEAVSAATAELASLRAQFEALAARVTPAP